LVTRIQLYHYFRSPRTIFSDQISALSQFSVTKSPLWWPEFSFITVFGHQEPSLVTRFQLCHSFRSPRASIALTSLWRPKNCLLYTSCYLWARNPRMARRIITPHINFFKGVW
jgi:hypothetical protein